LVTFEYILILQICEYVIFNFNKYKQPSKLYENLEYQKKVEEEAKRLAEQNKSTGEMQRIWKLLPLKKMMLVQVSVSPRFVLTIIGC
jgi:hypothetical protein